MTNPLEKHLLAQTVGHQSHFWHEVRALAVTSRLAGKPEEIVVDLGAGAGVLGEIVRRDRPSVQYRFFEPLESLATQVAARNGPRSRLADPADCRDATVVALLDVIEHVEAPKRFLAAVVESAPTGAYVIITVPALAALWSSWDVALGHHRRYSKRSLAEEVDGFPMEVVELGYLFPELVVPAFARRLLGSRNARTSPGCEFPTFPPWLEKLLLSTEKVTYRGRRWWPVGTSVLLVARRRLMA